MTWRSHLQTPFISGKDSLNNEFSYIGDDGEKQTISIPPSLLISALGQVDDVTRCVTMDLKQVGNRMYQVGTTRNELGGSHFSIVNQLAGGDVPQVDPENANRIFQAMHKAIMAGKVRSCHDISEGGLAAAAAEMAFAGGLGMQLDASRVLHQLDDNVPATPAILFSESNSRFLCEVQPEHVSAFQDLLGDAAVDIGEVTEGDQLEISVQGQTVIASSLARMKEAWQAPLRWSK